MDTRKTLKESETPALEIQGLSKRYATGTQALQNIDLSVEPGSFFALLGPNGAGKSTAISILAGLVKKNQGTVKIFGIDIDQEPEHAKSQLGLVPQEFNFNQFEKVIDIILNQAGYYGIPRAQAMPKTEHYLNKLGLWKKRHEMSRHLSGGMKRRLMIARALVHEPRMLILDEPTAGVDIEIRRHMWDFLREINEQGITVILTTHYLEEAEQLCRGVAIIDRGKIIQNTSVKQLLNKLNTETLILDLKTAVKMTDWPKTEQLEFHPIDDLTLEVRIDKGTGLNRLFETLNQHRIQVVSMRNKTNRLEELFLQLVNHNARAHAGVNTGPGTHNTSDANPG